MALVAYSDSEGSDIEPAAVAPNIKSTNSSTNSKATFQKVVDSSQPGSRKIKVELPSYKPESEPHDEQEGRPAKRSRTNGTFSGFNSLLPAPKRRTQNNGPKAGIGLKTSSEAAFSRESIGSRVPKQDNDYKVDDQQAVTWTSLTDSSETASVGTAMRNKNEDDVVKEPRLVGKTTRFMPLSVAGKKKKPKPNMPPIGDTLPAQEARQNQPAKDATPAVPETVSKAKRSLFTITQDEKHEEPQPSNSSYQPILEKKSESAGPAPTGQAASAMPSQAPANSLESIASDLNLTAAQRRQLFGRNGAGGGSNIQTFNTEAEYAANEQLRQAGELVEHRAVKAIAPGKHSLQQLVSNAKTQQDAMEDKWAAGRRERGEAGSKYGWGR